MANNPPTIAKTIKEPIATPYTLISSTLYFILNAVSAENQFTKNGIIVFIDNTNAAKIAAMVGLMNILR